MRQEVMRGLLASGFMLANGLSQFLSEAALAVFHEHIRQWPQGMVLLTDLSWEERWTSVCGWSLPSSLGKSEFCVRFM